MIAGTHDGYFKEDGIVAEEIRRSGADVVFVWGAPKQELWMKKFGPATGAHLLCGLGGFRMYLPAWWSGRQNFGLTMDWNGFTACAKSRAALAA